MDKPVDQQNSQAIDNDILRRDIVEDGLSRPILVGNDQIGGQRIEVALHAFHETFLPCVPASLPLNQFASVAASTYQRATRLAKAELVHSKNR